MLNLDTHILLFLLAAELRPKELALLEQDEEWGISGIVLWEINRLYAKKRINLSLHDSIMYDQVARLHIWPIDLPVAWALDQLDFESDPADMLIAATSIAYNIPLVTRDDRIRHSKIVPLA